MGMSRVVVLPYGCDKIMVRQKYTTTTRHDNKTTLDKTTTSVVHIFISMIEVRRTTRSWNYSRPLDIQLVVEGLASIKDMKMWKNNISHFVVTLACYNGMLYNPTHYKCNILMSTITITTLHYIFLQEIIVTLFPMRSYIVGLYIVLSINSQKLAKKTILGKTTRQDKARQT